MNKNKKIAIGITLTLLAAGTGYLIYKRSVNKKNAILMEEYISSLPKQNTAAAQTELENTISAGVINQIDSTSASALNGKTLVFDNKSYVLGKTTNTDFNDKVYRIAKALNEAMVGPSTNVDNFIAAFKRIGNKNAMVYMNIYYKALYKETMWQAINGETALYYGTKKAIDVLNLLDLPNYNPKITQHLQTLK